jgi:hypothetical protein
MHGAEYRIWRFVGGEDRIAPRSPVTDRHPLESPIAGTHAHERFAVACERKPARPASSIRSKLLRGILWANAA